MAINRVEGDNTANQIDVDYAADPEGDRIDANDVPDGSNDDVVDGFGGDDIIQSGEGDDVVNAGSGSDSVEGGAGNDLLIGDTPDGSDAGRAVFQWSLAPDPNDANPIDAADPIVLFTQDTGRVDVNFSVLSATGPVETEFAENPQDVSGVVTGGPVADANSSLSAGLANADSTDLKLQFSDEVTKVSFQINDLDGTENVQVFAFDADDNLLPVDLTGGADVSVVSGEEATGGGAAGTDDSPDTALQVNIEGPVAQLVIRYTDPDGTADGINVTDVYFDPPAADIVDTGAPGDDTLIGEEGDDTLLGEDGNDLLTGGTGADSIVGGADEDSIIGGTAGDIVDGGSTGVDNDTLDLSGAGPLRVAEEADDPDGNSTSGRIEFLADDGSVSGDMSFAEIETLILPENGAPVTQPDTAVTDEDTPVDIPVLANDSDPEGDTLTIGSATATNGTVTVNPDNTLTYTPNPDFNGSDTITYTADDGNGNMTPGTVTVTVTPVNDDPVAGDDTGTTDFETPVDIPVLANDTDVDGDTPSVDSATDGANGTTTVNGDGTITYTPDAGFSGTDSFDYTVTDGNGGTDTGTVTVTVGEAPPPARDGIIDGTAGPDLIDTAYDGDLDGDFVDAGDAILPGAAPDDDSIRAGDGDDTVLAGLGDDEVDGAGGNDSILGDVGSDTLSGGAGADTIDSGSPTAAVPLPDLGFGTTVPADGAPDDDRDLVDGGDGDDVISTGDDADTIAGGAGNDLIDGGIDADEIDGGDGADTITGNEGSDTINAGAGDDVVFGGLDPSFPDELNIPDATDPEPDNGRDVIDGGDGNDTILGQDDDDTITGGAGDDVIASGIDDDSVEGGVGNDQITGGSGTDTLSGGDDRDTFLGGDSGEFVDGGAGGDDFDTLDLRGEGPVSVIFTTPDEEDGLAFFEDGGFLTFEEIESVLTDGRPDRDGIVEGTFGDDVIDVNYTGDPDGDFVDNDDALLPGEVGDDDIIIGKTGNDTINAALGDDFVLAGEGGDAVDAGSGDDEVFGEAGSDFIEGAQGNDFVEGGAGDDTLDAGRGDDTMLGGAGDDNLTGNPGADSLVGGDGNDTLIGNDDSDTLEGGAGDDVISTGPGEDQVSGGDDRDTIRVVGQDDQFVDGNEGGDDFDTLEVFGNAEVEFDLDNAENGTVFYLDDGGARSGVTTRFVNIENVVIVPPDALDGVVEGDDGDNLIDAAYTGDPEGDRIDSFDSLENFVDQPDDVLEPSDFFEFLGGTPRGDQRDAVEAGAGNDTVLSGAGDDIVRGGLGDDSIEGGLGFDDLSGNEGADTIDGGLGTDKIFGGGGDDSLIGDLGDDTLLGGDGADTIDGGFGDNVVESGAGADIIETGGDDDTIDAGAGDDFISSGAGDDSVLGSEDNDTVFAGAGEDSVLGGDGDDRISGGTAGVTGTAAIGQTPDTLIGGAGDDIIDGSSGDDNIEGGIGSDTIAGGSGGDTVDAGDGDDVVYLGGEIDILTGDVTLESDSPDLLAANAIESGDNIAFGGGGADTIIGTSNNDSIDGGPGADSILGLGAEDTLSGGQGADTVDGGDGDDIVDGGVGGDSLLGGSGLDLLTGGVGDDTLDGGEGVDTLFGGDARDLLIGRFGDTVDGGTGDGGTPGDDFDTLDLTEVTPTDGSVELDGVTTDADGDSRSGTAIIRDASGGELGRVEFSEIESLIPCFTPGTAIATPRGEMRVEDLQPGDKVITRDNGLQEIRWIGHRDLSGQELVQAPHLRPVLIRAGALGHGLPERDMLVSPQHRVLLTSENAALYFDEREVLSAAKYLTAMDGIDQVEASGTTYIHFMFDRHEVVLSNGAWTESFQPGEQVLDGMGSDQRNEIYDLFPELRELQGIKAYHAARRSLKKHEARLLVG